MRYFGKFTINKFDDILLIDLGAYNINYILTIYKVFSSVVCPCEHVWARVYIHNAHTRMSCITRVLLNARVRVRVRVCYA